MTEYVLFNKENRVWWYHGSDTPPFTTLLSLAKRYASMTEALLDAERFHLSDYEAVPVRGEKSDG